MNRIFTELQAPRRVSRRGLQARADAGVPPSGGRSSTNILGTRNVAEVALNSEVERFVLVSTDKAVRPDQRDGSDQSAWPN